MILTRVGFIDMTRHKMDVQKFNTNTARLYGWAERNEAEVEALNNGIQLRVTKYGQAIDFYPSTGKIMGNHKYTVLPEQKKGFIKILNELYQKPKVKKTKCVCNHFYVYWDGVACLHKLFREHEVEAVTREVVYGRVQFTLWHDYHPRYRNGSRNQLTERDEILLAIELCKQWKVPMIRL